MVTRIGRGGMGEVWRADDLVLETPVALKLIHQNSPETRERIIGEARLARQITHPAVCRVFDVGEAEGEIFLSMELVQGEDLSTLVRRVGRLPSEKVIDIGRQLCAGLAAAHAQGVLHRDLKPANVLVDQNGSIRIADFGIAMVADETRRDLLAGTPDYMAPEQLVPRATLSARTDLYALGLILFELVAGRRPFAHSIGRLDPAPEAIHARARRRPAARTHDHAGDRAGPAQSAGVGGRDGGHPPAGGTRLEADAHGTMAGRRCVDRRWPLWPPRSPRCS